MSAEPAPEALIFELGDGLTVRPAEPDDADEVYAVVERNRAYLSEWMPWAADQTLELTRQFIAIGERQLAANQGFQAVVLDRDRIVGAIGFHSVDWANSATTLGYWLAEDAQGRGIMTRAVRALTDHAFSVWNLHRVEIGAATENRRSRAIPIRLGFVEEGVRRHAELVGGRYLDIVIHGMLADEWRRAG